MQTGLRARAYHITDMDYLGFGHVVDSCPINRTEQTAAASGLKCGVDKFGNSQYLCVPNFKKTAIVEYCYKGTVGLHKKGSCLVVSNDGIVDIFSCGNFIEGCTTDFFKSSDLYKYPACHQINKEAGCFYADPMCQKINPETASRNTTFATPNTTFNEFSTTLNYANSSSDTDYGQISAGVIAGITVPLLLLILGIFFIGYWKKKRVRKRKRDVEERFLSESKLNKEEKGGNAKTGSADEDVQEPLIHVSEEMQSMISELKQSASMDCCEGDKEVIKPDGQIEEFTSESEFNKLGNGGNAMTDSKDEVSNEIVELNEDGLSRRESTKKHISSDEKKVTPRERQLKQSAFMDYCEGDKEVIKPDGQIEEFTSASEFNKVGNGGNAMTDSKDEVSNKIVELNEDGLSTRENPRKDTYNDDTYNDENELTPRERYQFSTLTNDEVSVLYCFLCSDSGPPDFTDTAWLDMLNKIRQRVYRKENPVTSEEAQQTLDRLKSRDFLWEDQDKIKEDIKDETMYKIASRDREILFLYSSYDTASVYLRSYRYRRKPGEKCVISYGCGFLLIRRLQMNILTNVTMEDTGILDEIYQILNVPKAISQGNHSERDKFLSDQKQEGEAVQYRGRSQDSVHHVTWLWRDRNHARPDIVRSCIGLHPHWDIYIINNKAYRKPNMYSYVEKKYQFRFSYLKNCRLIRGPS